MTRSSCLSRSSSKTFLIILRCGAHKAQRKLRTNIHSSLRESSRYWHVRRLIRCKTLGKLAVEMKTTSAHGSICVSVVKCDISCNTVSSSKRHMYGDCSFAAYVNLISVRENHECAARYVVNFEFSKLITRFAKIYIYL